jgi:uncharacterized protein (DUF427 family)
MLQACPEKRAFGEPAFLQGQRDERQENGARLRLQRAGLRGLEGAIRGKLIPVRQEGQAEHRRFPMKATWRGQVIAESDRTLEVGGYRYFPRESVRMELLAAAPKTASDLACPHGVQFYDVAQDGARSERSAWSYEAPRAAMTQVDHWIGFWNDVEIQ